MRVFTYVFVLCGTLGTYVALANFRYSGMLINPDGSISFSSPQFFVGGAWASVNAFGYDGGVCKILGYRGQEYFESIDVDKQRSARIVTVYNRGAFGGVWQSDANQVLPSVTCGLSKKSELMFSYAARHVNADSSISFVKPRFRYMNSWIPIGYDYPGLGAQSLCRFWGFRGKSSIDFNFSEDRGKVVLLRPWLKAPYVKEIYPKGVPILSLICRK